MKDIISITLGVIFSVSQQIIKKKSYKLVLILQAQCNHEFSPVKFDCTNKNFNPFPSLLIAWIHLFLAVFSICSEIVKTYAVFFIAYFINYILLFFSPNENTNIRHTPFRSFRSIFSHYLITSVSVDKAADSCKNRA